MLEACGLGNICDIQGVRKVAAPRACYGKMAEQSPGKDSTSGHWELCGVILRKPFPTYPQGFPEPIIREFERRINHRTLGNIPASGTDIIQDLGDEHIRLRRPIVYTSADSVFQIACHVDVFPLDELYEFCIIARDLLQGEHGVARVIARPFAGATPNFYRTKDRRDFSLPPPEPTLLDIMKKSNFPVIAIGKVEDLFGHRGYTQSFHSVNNAECARYVLKIMADVPQGLIFANFVQFDMDWGHRNDIQGFKQGLVDIDGALKEIIDTMTDHDILFITADHGNDPTTPSTDHSREYVPILVVTSHPIGHDLGIRKSFADVAQTVARYFNVMGMEHGEDFLDACNA